MNIGTIFNKKDIFKKLHRKKDILMESSRFWRNTKMYENNFVHQKTRNNVTLFVLAILFELSMKTSRKNLWMRNEQI